MTGARGQGDVSPEEEPPGSRPGFLPPVPPRDPGPGAAARQAPAGSPSPGWGLARLVTAALLLVSAFLPWARGAVRLEGLGQAIDRELGTAAGVNLDGTGQVIPVFATVAIVMIVWSLLARDPRIGSLAAVPALLALLSCLIFLPRLDRFRQEAIGSGPLRLDGLEVTAGYGWYLSVASSLLLVGLCLTRRGG